MRCKTKSDVVPNPVGLLRNGQKSDGAPSTEIGYRAPNAKPTAPQDTCGTSLGKATCPKGRAPNADEAASAARASPSPPATYTAHAARGYENPTERDTPTAADRSEAKPTGAEPTTARPAPTTYHAADRRTAAPTSATTVGVAQRAEKAAEAPDPTETTTQTAGYPETTPATAGSTQTPV